MVIAKRDPVSAMFGYIEKKFWQVHGAIVTYAIYSSVHIARIRRLRMTMSCASLDLVSRRVDGSPP